MNWSLSENAADILKKIPPSKIRDLYAQAVYKLIRDFSDSHQEYSCYLPYGTFRLSIDIDNPLEEDYLYSFDIEMSETYSEDKHTHEINCFCDILLDLLEEEDFIYVSIPGDDHLYAIARGRTSEEILLIYVPGDTVLA